MSTRNDSRGAATRAVREPRSSRRGGAGGTLLGVFIGVVIGLAIAAGAAFYLMRGNPYQPGATATREPARDAAPRGGKSDKDNGKPRFDFYKILPGGEEPKMQAKAPERSSDRATVDRALTPPQDQATPDSRSAPNAMPQAGSAPANTPAPAASAEAKPAERFWLQAGSFANEGDAENLKARLALAGWEANVQQADVPDKGVRYRVRMGPFENTDELNRMKGELSKRGFDVAVIRF